MPREVECTICLTVTHIDEGPLMQTRLAEHVDWFTGQPCKAAGSLGVALEHSIVDPETGTATVEVRLW